MKPGMWMVLLGASLVGFTTARATTLPNACGDDKVQFDVTTQKGKPAPAPPEAGKAQVVFIEALNKTWGCWQCGTPSARYGMDGNWVGATKGSSYFSIEIAPGEHHLCAGWQSAMGHLRQMVGLAAFTAEAGKTYYFEAKVKLHVHEYGTGADSSSETDRDLQFVQVNEDEGQYRIKASPVSVFKARQ